MTRFARPRPANQIRHPRHIDHAEGRVARAIEQQTAKLPSDLFLWAAGASMLGSMALCLVDRREDAILVGQWAPTFLLLGVYNKLVKLEGHDYRHGH